jgi:hypothetical protein
MNIQEFGQLIPIPSVPRQLCEAFARQMQPERADAVRQRAIAVWVVSQYLDRYGYQSDYTTSCAWNLALQALTDLADLEIKNDNISLGIVECIPMAASAETLAIPEQAVMGDRIAYIAVEINPENTWGAIVGFTPALEIDFPELSIDRDDLLPADRLLDLLYNAEDLADESLFSELQEYLSNRSEWSAEQRQAIVAQLERALLLESAEPLQVESAAQELEALIGQSSSELAKELVMNREDATDSDRQKLRSIIGRLFQSLRDTLE